MALPIPNEGLSLGVEPFENTPLPSAPAPLAGQTLGTPPAGAPQMPQQPQMLPSVAAARQGLANAAGQEGNRFRTAFAHLAGVDPLQGTKALAQFDLQQQQIAQQQQRMQLETMQGGMAALMKFADLDPDTQKNLAPAFIPYVQQSFKQSGIEVPPDLFTAMATQPGVAKTAMDIFFQDRAYTEADKNAYLPALRKLKGPQIQEYLTKIQNDKVASTVARLSMQMPQIVSTIRMGAQLAPGQPVPLEEITKGFASDERVAGSPVLQRAVHELFYGTGSADRLKAWGIGTNADTAGQMNKWKWEDILGTGGAARFALEHPIVRKTTEDTQHVLGREPTPFEIWSRINAAERAKLMANVNEQITRVPITIKRAEEEGRQLTMKELGDYVTIAGLDRGVLQRPPAGTTVAEARRIAVDITDKQREAVRSSHDSEIILDKLDTLSKRLITATNAWDANSQGVKLWMGATTGSNVIAKTYLDTRDAFMGPLSRSISSERGVLTDLDLARIKGALTGLRDTKASRELKIATIREIVNLNRTAVLEEVRGEQLDALKTKYRGNVEKLLNKLDAAQVVPSGHKKLRQGDRIYAVPDKDVETWTKQGWKVID